jgi:polysaccharide biosynthesis transport protein
MVHGSSVHDPRGASSHFGVDAGMGEADAGGPGVDRHANSNLFRLAHRLLRGRYLLTLALAAVFAIIGAVFGFASTRPMFQTRGTIRVQSQPAGQMNFGGGNSFAFIATQAALMRNDRVLQVAVEHEAWRALGLGTGVDAQEELLESLDVSQEPGSTELLYITSTHRSGAFTKAAVQSILDAFSKFSEDNDRLEQEATTATYRDSKNQVERAIRDAQDRILELSKEFGTTDLKTAIDLKTLQINEVDAQITSLTMRLAELPEQPAPDANAPPGPDAAEPARKWTPLEIARVDPTMKEYLEVESSAAANYEMLRHRFSDQHNAVKRAADELAKARIKIERYADGWKADPDVKEQVRALTSNDRVEIERVRKNKAEALSALIAERTRLNQSQLLMTSITEQIKRDTQKLDEIEANIDAQNLRTQIAKDINPAGRMKVLSYGSTPLNPSLDRRKQFAAAGFVLGGGFPVVAMLLLGLVDRRFRYSDDADGSGINAPMLGILPILPPDMRDEERRTVAAHCVHNIRVLLQLSGEVSGAKVFVVTSPTAGDGKTSLVLSLGLSFAATGSRTVVVDFDTVGTGLSASLDARKSGGILDAIRTGQLAGCVHPSGVDDNLFIIPASPGDDMHVSRVSTSSVRRLVANLREKFDAVLIDTGPILGSIEASLAAAQADGVVLVIGRGQHHTHVKRAVDRIRAVGGRLAGMVFNRATASDFRRSVSAASVRSVPRGLPPGPSSRGGGLSNAGPVAATMARDMDSAQTHGRSA